MPESVRTGENAFRLAHGVGVWEYRAARPEEGAVFDRAMAANSRMVVRSLLDAYDFGRFGTIVDVGGGNGVLLAALLAEYPKLRGVLFDQPHVVAGVDLGRAPRSSAATSSRASPKWATRISKIAVSSPSILGSSTGVMVTAAEDCPMGIVMEPFTSACIGAVRGAAADAVQDGYGRSVEPVRAKVNVPGSGPFHWPPHRWRRR